MGFKVHSAGEATGYQNNQNKTKQSSLSVHVFDFSEKNRFCNSLKICSHRKIETIVDDLIKERNKSCVIKFFNSIFAFDKAKTTDTQTKMAKQMLKKIEKTLKQQGIDLGVLNEEEQKQYFKIMLKHAGGLINNNEFLAQTTSFNKERLSHIVKSNSHGLKKYFSCFRKSFKKASDESAKLNIAAVSTSSEYLPEDATQELMLLYSSTIPERRKEIISEALKRLPDGISKEEILELAMSSENMSVLEINFAKDYIMASDLPENVKQEKLKMLDGFAKQDALRKISTIIAKSVCEYKNIKFDIVMYEINKEDEIINYIQENKKKLSKKQEDLSVQKNKLKNDIYYKKTKLKKLKSKYCENQTNSIKKQLNSEKGNIKKLLNEFRDLTSCIKENENNLAAQNLQTEMHISFKSNIINSSGLV